PGGPPTGRVERTQWDPPSWVTQRSGPKTQPLFTSAKRTFRTPVPPSGANDVGGAGMPAQVRPPSRVRRRETVHVGHVAPRTQPVCSETKVTEAGEKPLGTGAPAGPAGEGVIVGMGTDAVGETGPAVTEAEPASAGVGLRCGPVADLELHPAPSATTAAMARIWKAFIPMAPG